MAYVATNKSKQTIPVRDDAGKHFVAPGDSLVLTGDQHRAAAEDAGLSVQWEDPAARAAKPVTEPEATDAKPDKAEPDKAADTSGPAKPKAPAGE